MNPTDTLFWPYILPILEAQKEKNGVTYVNFSDANGMDRMIADSVSEDIYPGIFVFRPKYVTKNVNGHLLVAEFQAVIYVWCKPEDNERTDEDAAYTHAETIATSIIQKLQHDSRVSKNFLEFDSIHLEPVLYLSADRAFGYEMKFRMGLAANQMFC